MIATYVVIGMALLTMLYIFYITLLEMKSASFGLCFAWVVLYVVMLVSLIVLLYKFVERTKTNEYDVVINHTTKDNVSLTYTANIKIANEDCATTTIGDLKNKAYAQAGITPSPKDTVAIKPQVNIIERIEPYDCVNPD